MSPKPTKTSNSTIVCVVNTSYMYERLSVDRMIEPMKISPPIVGVPAFFRWLLGPSSRMLCPNFNLLRAGTIKYPNSAEIMNATAMAINIVVSVMLFLLLSSEAAFNRQLQTPHSEILCDSLFCI